MPERQALLEAAARLEAAATTLGEEFSKVDAFAHDTARAHQRTRTLANWLVLGFVVHLVIIAVLALALVRVDDAADDANEASSAVTQSQRSRLAACENSNEERIASRQLWLSVIDLAFAPDPGERLDADDRAERAKYRTLVNATYGQRDCQQVVNGVQSPPAAQ